MPEEESSGIRLARVEDAIKVQSKDHERMHKENRVLLESIDAKVDLHDGRITDLERAALIEQGRKEQASSSQKIIFTLLGIIVPIASGIASWAIHKIWP